MVFSRSLSISATSKRHAWTRSIAYLRSRMDRSAPIVTFSVHPRPFQGCSWVPLIMVVNLNLVKNSALERFDRNLNSPASPSGYDLSVEPSHLLLNAGMLGYWVMDDVMNVASCTSQLTVDPIGPKVPRGQKPPDSQRR